MNKKSQPILDSNFLLDQLLEYGGLKNDAALSRELDVAPPVISKLRHNKLPFGPSLYIKTMRVFGLSLGDIDAALGLPT